MTTHSHWSRAPFTAAGIFALLLTYALPLTAQAYTVLITGANSGIGLEFAKQYAAKGWTVIATDRRTEPPKSLTDLAARYKNVRIERLDVTSVAEARALARKLAGVPIDVLINNAGVGANRDVSDPAGLSHCAASRRASHPG